MPFEVYMPPPHRRGHRLRGRFASLTVNGILTLAADAAKLWRDPPTFVELLWDPERAAIALRPSTDPNAWNFTRTRSNSYRVNVRGMLAHHGVDVRKTVVGKVALEAGLLVVELPSTNSEGALVVE